MKVKTKTTTTVLKGKVSKNRTTASKDSGLSTTFLYLDGALIAKALNNKKTADSFKQRLLKDRFTQLECMYKALTTAQLNAFKEYSEYYNIMHQTNLTSAQIFKKLGMEYRLSDFLTDKLNVKYTAKLKTTSNKEMIIELITTNNEASKDLITL